MDERGQLGHLWKRQVVGSLIFLLLTAARCITINHVAGWSCQLTVDPSRIIVRTLIQIFTSDEGCNRAPGICDYRQQQGRV